MTKAIGAVPADGGAATHPGWPAVTTTSPAAVCEKHLAGRDRVQTLGPAAAPGRVTIIVTGPGGFR